MSAVGRARALFVILLLCAGCGDTGLLQPNHYPPENHLVPGQTSFTNLEPSAGSFLGGWPHYGSFGGNCSAGGSGVAPAAPRDPPSGRQGRAEEADIYRVEGDRLYYLNAYRGLLVLDIADPKKPALLARLPVYGRPVEMFVEQGAVFALVSDVHGLARKKGTVELKQRSTSQLVVVDTSGGRPPVVTRRLNIRGKLREGVSRRVGDIVYVVSSVSSTHGWGWNMPGKLPGQQQEQAWVHSFDVSDAGDVKPADRLLVFKGGAYATSSSQHAEARTFDGITISATANALMVAENWTTRGYIGGGPGGCASSHRLQQAKVSVVDISDAAGKIRLHSRFETYGSLGDQFKQTYVHDQKTGKATYYGIFLRRELSSSGCSGSSVLQNRLESWDVSDGASPRRLGALVFGKPGETVRGSLFDHSRGVAYAITARAVDPLYAISIAEPKKMKVLSEVDGLSGDINVFRFTGDKKFLLGVGRDNTKTCKGYIDATNGQVTKVAVSLIDVRKLDSVRLVQRRCVDVSHTSWVGSPVNLDLDQAHKMIGLHSDGETNLIAVPVHYYRSAAQATRYVNRFESAVGLMSWDLERYDPSKDHTAQTVLQNHGTIIHPNGRVRRTVLVTHKETSRRLMVNLSDTHVSLVDLTDLSKPATRAALEVAPHVSRAFRFGDYLVQHVHPGESGGVPWYEQHLLPSTFRVRALSGGQEPGEVVATFKVDRVQAAAKSGHRLVLLRHIPVAVKKTGWDGPYWDRQTRTEALIYDLSNPRKPRRGGSVLLAEEQMPVEGLWLGGHGFRGSHRFTDLANEDHFSSGDWLVTDRGLAFLEAREHSPGTISASRALVLVDLSDPARPKKSAIPLPVSSSWLPLGLVGDAGAPGSVYLIYKQAVGEVTLDDDFYTKYRYGAQRWENAKGKWTRGAAVNLPGRLLRTWIRKGKRMYLTSDFVYPPYAAGWHRERLSWGVREDHDAAPQYVRLNLLEETAAGGQPAARYMSSYTFKDHYPTDLARAGDRLLVLSRRFDSYDYYWFLRSYYYRHYTNEKVPTTDQLKDRLTSLDISAGALRKEYHAAFDTMWMSLWGSHRGTVLASVRGQGILTLDPGTLDLRYLRTLEPASHVTPDKDTALVTAGHGGTTAVDIETLPAVPVISD